MTVHITAMVDRGKGWWDITSSQQAMTAGTFFTRRLAALTGLNTSNVTRRHTAAQQRFASDVTLKTMVEDLYVLCTQKSQD